MTSAYAFTQSNVARDRTASPQPGLRYAWLLTRGSARRGPALPSAPRAL